MTDWFRSWHGAPTDNKWLVIAKRAKTKPGVVSAIWWALLDHASQAAERGRVSDFDVETYAHYSGFDENVVEAVLKAITDKGLVLNGVLIAWERRQPAREDLTATDRKRKQRERESIEVTDKPIVSDDVTQCHAASRAVTTEESRTEQSRVEQKEESSSAPQAVAPRPTPSRGTRWPSHALVPGEWLEDAVAQCRQDGYLVPDLRREAGKFERYWSSKAGSNGRKADWRKTWINWAVKAAEDEHGRSGKKNGFGHKPNAHDAFLSAAAGLAGEDIQRSERGGNHHTPKPAGPALLASRLHRGAGEIGDTGLRENPEPD